MGTLECMRLGGYHTSLNIVGHTYVLQVSAARSVSGLLQAQVDGLQQQMATLQGETERAHNADQKQELAAAEQQLHEVQGQLDAAQRQLSSQAFVVSNSSRQFSTRQAADGQPQTNALDQEASRRASPKLSGHAGGHELQQPLAAASRGEQQLEVQLASVRGCAAASRKAALRVSERLLCCAQRSSVAVAFRAWQVFTLRACSAFFQEEAQSLADQVVHLHSQSVQNATAFIEGTAKRHKHQAMRPAVAAWKMLAHSQVCTQVH
jgi:hypothetical protein